MLTTRSINLVSLFIACLLFGLLLGNFILLTMSLIPLSLLIIAIVIQPPHNITLENSQIPSKVWIGDVVEINYEIAIEKGLGAISFYQEIPPHFALVEGNNMKLFWKGWHSKTFSFSFKVRCTKRGIYSLSPIHWESYHPLRLIQTQEGIFKANTELTVHPKLVNVRRIRGIPGIATSPFPVVDIAKIGVMTTDFREIREYIYGDPIKNINWKATARNTSSRNWPLTNEYEVEGKKAVWLFLDASSVLEVGTDIDNAFEYCLQATNSVVYYFIDRGYRVGMYVFNSGEQLYYPDSGKRQFLKISRELIKLKVGKKDNEFPIAVEKCKRYILGYNPLCIVVTRLDSWHGDEIIHGIKKLRRIQGHQRRRLPLMVINVGSYSVIQAHQEYEENALQLTQLNTRPKIQQLRRLGVSVLDWNPLKENIGSAFLKQIKSR